MAQGLGFLVYALGLGLELPLHCRDVGSGRYLLENVHCKSLFMALYWVLQALGSMSRALRHTPASRPTGPKILAKEH